MLKWGHKTVEDYNYRIVCTENKLHCVVFSCFYSALLFMEICVGEQAE